MKYSSKGILLMSAYRLDCGSLWFEPVTHHSHGSDGTILKWYIICSQVASIPQVSFLSHPPILSLFLLSLLLSLSLSLSLSPCFSLSPNTVVAAWLSTFERGSERERERGVGGAVNLSAMQRINEQ